MSESTNMSVSTSESIFTFLESVLGSKGSTSGVLGIQTDEMFQLSKRIVLKPREERYLEGKGDAERVRYLRFRRDALIYRSVLRGLMDGMESGELNRSLGSWWGIAPEVVSEIVAHQDGLKRFPLDTVKDINELRERMSRRMLVHHQKRIEFLRDEIERVELMDEETVIVEEIDSHQGRRTKKLPRTEVLVRLHRELSAADRDVSETLVGNWVEKPAQKVDSRSLKVVVETASSEFREAFEKIEKRDRPEGAVN